MYRGWISERRSGRSSWFRYGCLRNWCMLFTVVWYLKAVSGASMSVCDIFGPVVASQSWISEQRSGTFSAFATPPRRNLIHLPQSSVKPISLPYTPQTSKDHSIHYVVVKAIYDRGGDVEKVSYLLKAASLPILAWRPNTSNLPLVYTPPTISVTSPLNYHIFLTVSPARQGRISNFLT